MRAMTTGKQALRLLTRPIAAYIILSILYVTLIFTLPANRATLEAYNLTPLGYRIMAFSLSLPALISWLAAFIGFQKLEEYARAIKNTSDGRFFKRLAKGAAWLAWGLPITLIIATLLSGLANKWPSFLPAATIMTNYILLMVPLVAFSNIGGAASGLVGHARLKFNTYSNRLVILMFIIGGVVYCVLTFRWFDLKTPGSTHNPYYMPLWLTLLTLTIPYLYAWFVGLLATYELAIYSRSVQGLLYRSALRYLAGGLIVVIAASIILQYITIAQPSYGKITFDWRLLGVLTFRLLRGVGFVLIILGAARLKKIEEI